MNFDWAIFGETYIAQIVVTVAALALLWLLKFVIRRVAKKMGAMLGKPRERVRHVRKIIGAVLNITFLICIALLWGVKPENLALTLSSVLAFLGVAMFAQWSVLSNVTAGIIMFFSAPYHVGEAIRVIDKDVPLEAVIEHVGAFYTHLRTTEGELVVLPNNIFLQKIVGIK
jgi:small-conductance mechanosensitive channel